MLLAVIGFSLTPLLIGVAGERSPFMFNAAWRIGVILGGITFLMTFHLRTLREWAAWRLTAKRALSWPIFLGMISYLERAFFAWSTQYIDISATAVIYETWPILVIVLTAWLFRQEARYERLSSTTLGLIIVGFLGFSMVVLSQTGGVTGLSDSSLTALAAGVLLAVIAALLVSLTAFSFKWGIDIAFVLSTALDRPRRSMELFGVVLGIVVSSTLSVPFTAVIGFSRGEPIEYVSVGIGLVGGIFAGAFASITWRVANVMTRSLAINSISYLTPIVALFWLFAFSMVEQVRIDYLMIGTALIVGSNVLMNYFQVDVQRRRSNQVQPVGENISNLISGGESDTVEFKSTLRANLHTGRNDREVERAALKTVAAFLNSDGGTLVIGIGDDADPVGVRADNFANEDRMSLHLVNILGSRLGSGALSHTRIGFVDYEDQRVLVVRCERSRSPIYLTDGNSESFYIRTGPSTTELTVSAALDYIGHRFS